MSGLAPSIPSILPVVGDEPRRSALDAFLERASEWLNPILVKEARQALKSRQFVVTFGLVLLYSWGVSIVGLAMIGPEATYGANGPVMFGWYYAGLAFCLLIVVPFGAFRSLAVEQEERTYELLSITALKPRQIVSGKLGSAVVQMLVYLSALSPCLAFTYMLRGIDVLTILYILAWTVLASLGLSQAALVMGTLTENKALQVVLAVVVILGLVVAAIIGLYAALGLVFFDRLDFANIDFLVGNAVGLTAWASYLALGFFASVARITFASDNRSTRLRVVMLLQHCLFAGWLAWPWFTMETISVAMFGILGSFAGCAGIHWFVMGALMTSESPQLSLRVKRSLPQSLLGRVFLTWFNPGPGTGYIFAIGGAAGAFLLILAAQMTDRGILAASSGRGVGFSSPRLFCFGALGISYLAIYLGIGMAIIRLARRFWSIDLLGGLLIHLILVLLGCVIPCLAGMMISSNGQLDWSLLQTPCFPWTLARFLNYGPGSYLPSDTTALMLIVPLAAGVVILANLPSVVRELRHVRIAPPARVIEEEAKFAPPPPPAPPQSPWD
jgi:hypothetical protein